MRKQPHYRPLRGFTLIELIVIVVCVAVAAVIVLPTVSDNSGEQLRGAAQVLAADLEYAQSESMSRTDDPRMLVIYTDSGGYLISTRSNPTTPVTNKVGNVDYVTRFGTGRVAMLTKVRVGSYSLGGDNRLSFGALGQLDQPATATIQLVCGSRSIVISVDPTTGEITTGALQ
ncbi:MAG: prepilin-type N-terminal cleavage/methylation domain-containing protein [Planctomycetota bacterium]|nr:prepilin-type N-terminal cleavage/methylation domain-containing protein [Planctomycetota bacterium]